MPTGRTDPWARGQKQRTGDAIMYLLVHVAEDPTARAVLRQWFPTATLGDPAAASAMIVALAADLHLSSFPWAVPILTAQFELWAQNVATGESLKILHLAPDPDAPPERSRDPRATLRRDVELFYRVHVKGERPTTVRRAYRRAHPDASPLSAQNIHDAVKRVHAWLSHPMFAADHIPDDNASKS